MKAAHTPLGYTVRLGRDVCLLGVGLIGLLYTPPSVQHFTDRTHLVALLWAGFFVLGAVLGLVGVIREHPLIELLGSGLLVAAFIVWSVAALTAPDVTWATVQIFLVFVGAIFGQVYRSWIIANGVLGR